MGDCDTGICEDGNDTPVQHSTEQIKQQCKKVCLLYTSDAADE